jgi:hypothetical protein
VRAGNAVANAATPTRLLEWPLRQRFKGGGELPRQDSNANPPRKPMIRRQDGVRRLRGEVASRLSKNWSSGGAPDPASGRGQTPKGGGRFAASVGRAAPVAAHELASGRGQTPKGGGCFATFPLIEVGLENFTRALPDTMSRGFPRKYGFFISLDTVQDFRDAAKMTTQHATLMYHL